MSKEIQLTQGKVAIVDDEDFEELNKYKWTLMKSGAEVCYAYRKEYPTNKSILMHKTLVNFNMVDHIDGNGLNNQKSNLRECNKSTNDANRKKQRNNTSGYKGVYYENPTGRWYSKIGYKMKQIRIGSFESKEEAARAYDKKAKELFGEFAKLNFEE